MCILATIAVTSLSRRWVPAYRQRAYFMLFFSTFLATLSERIETFLQMNPSDASWYAPLEMAMGSTYFIFHLGSGFFYLKYILAVLDIYVDIKKPVDFFTIFLNFLIGIVLVFINLFTPVLFYYDQNGIYHRGKFIYLFYIIAGYYIIYGIILTFRFKKLMSARTKMVVLSYVIMVLSGLLIQFFFPTVLIENLFGTISITLVYISLQNPSEMVDENLNTLNRKAFLEGLDIKTGRKITHFTIFVTIDNVRVLSDEIGYTQAQAVLKKIAGNLKRAGKEFGLQTYTYRYSEYTFAITVHNADTRRAEIFTEAIAKRFHEPLEFSNMAIRVEGHCFLMRYPDDFKTVTELLRKLDVIFDDIETQRDVIIDVSKIDFNESDKILDYDMLARKGLDSKTMIIKYQPVLSKIYRINYISDILCFFPDESGNEVDMRRYALDIKATQAVLDVDEYVYRRACRALAFWNAGDKNGKYRAIVGLSQGEISRPDFIRRIKKIAREERVELSWITLKLNETTITTMNSVAERNIKTLGDLKCSVIVDKFGSGYGDLDKILALPVTQVNIDHEILIKAAESDKMKLVAQGIVNLFHDISIFVGAADISSENELKMAEELGCDYIMGNYLGPPTKDSSFVKYINAYFEEG